MGTKIVKISPQALQRLITKGGRSECTKGIPRDAKFQRSWEGADGRFCLLFTSDQWEETEEIEEIDIMVLT